MSLSMLPNILTVARIAAVVPLVWLMLAESFGWAFVVAMIAGVSDALDGYLARRFAWQSHFGGWADPAADKLLMSASYVTLAYLQVLPIWLSILVIGKDLFIVLGALSYRRLFGQFKATPTRLSKFTTLSQVIFIWLVLIGLIGFPIPDAWSTGLVVLVAGLTGMTLIQYVVIWGRRAWHQNHPQDMA